MKKKSFIAVFLLFLVSILTLDNLYAISPKIPSEQPAGAASD
ncbi:MAG: hypothetical protein ACFHVJ_02000 [Aestuariibacter sp.]